MPASSLTRLAPAKRFALLEAATHAVRTSAASADDDELFAFMDEGDSSAPTEPVRAEEPWVLLIVDDESQVHATTKLALRRARFGERPVRFMHAYSAAEARTLIAAEPMIDLVLLDVVMETREAGLDLVRELRGPLGRPDLKILIRSGQPGLESEASVRARYAVNGYLQKSFQTHELMLETIGSILLGARPDPSLAS